MKKNFIFLIIGIILCTIFHACVTSALSVAVHVPEKYTNVNAGERFYFEIEIKYPENPVRKDLILNYEILTQKGDLLATSKVLKAVETQASFIDFIVIPESAKEGLHLIKVNLADYEDLSEEVSASFHIVKGNELIVYFFILLGVMLLIGVLVVFSILWSRRKK